MSIFRPDLMVKDLHSVPLEALKEKGIKFLLFDVDNTIVPYNSQGLTEETIAWFEKPRTMGFSMSILSNNKEERLVPVAEKLGIHFVERSKKPLPVGAKKAMALLQASPEETAMIGDQLITDVCGGNLMGFYTIVVEPINKKELWITRINRQWEKLLYKIMKLK